MCNLYTQHKSADEIARIFAALQMPLRFPEGVPNLAPRDVRITDPAPIVRASAQAAIDDAPHAYELVTRRWSWPGPGGKPVYNFRSDGREFLAGRVLIVADGFYEFTAPADPKQKRKDRWLFTAVGAPLVAIAGFVRSVSGIGPGTTEAFTMLTTEPGPGVAPIHTRQVALLTPDRWRAWLDHSVPVRDLIGPLPAGTLTVTRSVA